MTTSTRYVSVNFYGPEPSFQGIADKLKIKPGVQVTAGQNYISKPNPPDKPFWPVLVTSHTPAVIISEDAEERNEAGKLARWEMLKSRLFLVIPADTSREPKTEPDNITDIEGAAQFVTSNLPDGLALKMLHI